MQSIAVIAPSWKHFADPLFHQCYWELYYATILRNRLAGKIGVEVIDLRGTSREDLACRVDALPERDAYFYWLFKTVDAGEHYETARQLKARYPKSLHIAGGTHAEKLSEDAARHFDAVVLGPGETCFPKAVEDIEHNHLQQFYRDDWRNAHFRDCPYPERDFLPPERVVNDRLFTPFGGGLGTMVYFSRGCMNRCEFCILNVPHGLQVRNPATVRAEIKYLKENYGVRGVLLKEEIAIPPSPKASRELMEAIGESDVIWRGQTTSQATGEQLAMARQSGCQELAVGVETVDENVMRLINKSWQSLDQVRRFLARARELGIKIKLCLILGLPGEKEDIVEKCMKFIEENEVEFVNVSGLCPMPGSPMYEDPERFGIAVIDRDWNKHSHLVYRFSDLEAVGLPFEYARDAPWGKALTREQIVANIRKLQRWLEERGNRY